MLHLTLFLAAVNFSGQDGNNGMIAPFVLSRTGSDQTALGMVQTAVALGLLAGSLIVTSAKPAKGQGEARLCVLRSGLPAILFQSLSASQMGVVHRGVRIVFGRSGDERQPDCHSAGKRAGGDAGARVFCKRHAVQLHDSAGIVSGRRAGGPRLWSLMATEGTVQSALAAVFGTGGGRESP